MENNLLPEIIYENLPDFLKRLTNPFTGRERDIILLSSLGVLSASLPNVFGVYDRNRFSPNLYLLIIAPPASGKGVMNMSKKLIEKTHRMIKENSIADIADCEDQKKDNKDKKQKCPDLEIKIIPGNVSSSKFYKHIQNSNHGILIFETEADTISVMLKQDWGNFSDVLRKAFHHETVSISRDIDDKYFEISNPKLSLVISGTANQVQPLIQSKENGLFSRFLFYMFEESTGWKDVSPNGATVDYNHLFSDAGDEMFKLHENLEKNQSEVEIKLSESQWLKFNDTMTRVVEAFIKEKKIDDIAVLKRHGVMMFRICMILTIIRHKDSNSFENSIICNDDDFDCALNIIKSTIDHSIRVSSLLNIPNGKKEKFLTVREILLLAELPNDFERKLAIEKGTNLNIPERTIDYFLKRWIDNEIISKIANGKFKKKT